MEQLNKILENVKNGAVKIKLAEKQILNLFGVGDYFNKEQIKKISKMLASVSKEAYLEAGGNEDEYKKWWDKRNEISVNS